MSTPPGVDPLNYEINLECASCGHAQFMHCPVCGCESTRRALTPTTGSIGCGCSGFARPDGAPDDGLGVWWDHAHGEPA